MKRSRSAALRFAAREAVAEAARLGGDLASDTAAQVVMSGWRREAGVPFDHQRMTIPHTYPGIVARIQRALDVPQRGVVGGAPVKPQEWDPVLAARLRQLETRPLVALGTAFQIMDVMRERGGDMPYTQAEFRERLPEVVDVLEAAATQLQRQVTEAGHVTPLPDREPAGGRGLDQ